MRAEEERLFPAVVALERQEIEGFPLETLEAYEAHHLRTAASIRALRPLLAGQPEALAALDELDTDLHRHLHEENEVLFPRALATLARAY
jgi:iron-sulfur cluster repair protein YtfE (RIC family)